MVKDTRRQALGRAQPPIVIIIIIEEGEGDRVGVQRSPNAHESKLVRSTHRRKISQRVSRKHITRSTTYASKRAEGKDQ